MMRKNDKNMCGWHGDFSFHHTHFSIASSVMYIFGYVHQLCQISTLYSYAIVSIKEFNFPENEYEREKLILVSRIFNFFLYF